MEIKIIEFYPSFITNNRISGTLHIHIPSFGMDMRGIQVYAPKGKYQFFIPTKRQYDPDAKQTIVFPVLDFSDKKVKRDFLLSIATAAVPYIKAKLQKDARWLIPVVPYEKKTLLVWKTPKVPKKDINGNRFSSAKAVWSFKKA